mmetsp:Transcript_5270/g.5411  ORF Transcript_5270/g.5411 Transcript_5270/m.5411 type:complete len:272 (-) Transcript_5270:28-843(-)
MAADILFSTVERWQSLKGPSWGRLLDAGTGQHSLKWIQNLNTSSWTAITADHAMQSQITSDPNLKIRPCDNILVGNWMDPKFCDCLGKFDTILADYLIGAVDGFSPYNQDQILSRLKDHLKPGGRLYLVGMNPIPDYAPPPADIVTEIRRARDSCILLAGHRPYREYPVEWVTRHLEKSGLHILRSKSFTILHSEESMMRQLRVAQSKLQLMPNIALKQGMQVYLQDLGERIHTAVRSVEGCRIPLSFDYIVAAELIDTDANTTDNVGSIS